LSPDKVETPIEGVLMKTAKDDEACSEKSAKWFALLLLLSERNSSVRHRTQIHPLRNPVFDPQTREALALELTREWSEEFYDR
jgi:hypothetical protein